MNNSRIVARFLLDTDGRPRTVNNGELRHYWIELHIEFPPDDTYAVTYQLHESYYDPVRESRNAKGAFAEKLTSYGDFTVQARLRTRNRVVTIAAELSEALSYGHRDKASESISKALGDIRAN